MLLVADRNELTDAHCRDERRKTKDKRRLLVSRISTLVLRRSRHVLRPSLGSIELHADDMKLDGTQW